MPLAEPLLEAPRGETSLWDAQLLPGKHPSVVRRPETQSKTGNNLREQADHESQNVLHAPRDMESWTMQAFPPSFGSRRSLVAVVAGLSDLVDNTKTSTKSWLVKIHRLSRHLSRLTRQQC
jgi:hypothetical protein